MSTTTTGTSTQPLYPLPVDPVYPAGLFPEAAPGTVNLFGYHATWCQSELKQSGADANEHGPACMRSVGPAVHGMRPDGQEERVNVEMISSYTHGVYTAGGNFQESRIKVSSWSEMEDENDRYFWLQGVHLGSGEARRLAAALLRAADRIDGLD